MDKNSVKWVLCFIFVTGLFIVPSSHDVLMELTKVYPYFMGFCKFAVLAFLGELMGQRISNGHWKRTKGIRLRIFSWGLMGTAIAFVLPLSNAAGSVFYQQGMAFFGQESMWGTFASALTASIVFNLGPGPMVIIYHKFAETYIELGDGKASGIRKVTLDQVIKRIDWVKLFQFIILRVNLILFIPINTVVFLLPPDLRVLMAAYSSILLGLVLGYHSVKRNHLECCPS